MEGIIEFLVQCFFEGIPNMIAAAFDDEQPITIRCMAAIGGGLGFTIVAGAIAIALAATN